MTILQDLFYGNINPVSGTFDNDSEYGKTIRSVSENEEKLLTYLNDVEKSIFMDFTDAEAKISLLTAEEKFIRGFRLGALIMLEVMRGVEEI